MTAEHWDDRYRQTELVWSDQPNRWMVELTADLPPGAMLDLAGGEGRNAIWLAQRGWRTHVVDFSPVAIERARRWADEVTPPGTVTAAVGDAVQFRPTQLFDLVVVAYLQIAAPQRRQALRAAAAAVAEGGHLLVVAHDSANLTDGVGGPQDPVVLYTAADIAADLEGLDLTPVESGVRRRPVGDQFALDAVHFAHR